MNLAQVDIQRVFSPARSFTSVGSLVSVLVKLISLGAGAVFMITIMYAAFEYITSDGEEEKVNKAKKAFTNGAIGMIIVVIAYWAVQIISRFLSLNF